MADTANQTEAPTPVLMHIEVINGLPDPIEDMYNGSPVTFPTGVPVAVSLEVANHCFGYPIDYHGFAPFPPELIRQMAVHMARRWGWATPANMEWTAHKRPKYVEYAEQIKFTPIFYELRRIGPDDPRPALVEDAQEPAPPAPVAAETTKVGKKSRNYKDATRAKRDDQKNKARGGRASGRSPHINVAEA
jgi:hypothetical protein